MGEILYDLEQALRSKKEKIRPEEENFFRACKSDASRFFRFNALAAGCLTFSATGRLNLLSQISLSGGAAALFGLWRFGRHLDSCVDRVLAHTGDRMQFELANILSLSISFLKKFLMIQTQISQNYCGGIELSLMMLFVVKVHTRVTLPATPKVTPTATTMVTHTKTTRIPTTECTVTPVMTLTAKELIPSPKKFLGTLELI
ncbi:hypothetical protein F2P56_015708 [Juglans regia]|uniref:Uncharacterized protein LOC109007277 isoform X4 n=2 Tax=Juglans regia TaxID=51240 RepID=A0A2I4GEV1_JUGRE|nr:uncharacterized protein LOC109007277 isoform X4 [Juglans regia]KAF5465727.1 hypothetical protein F2P56_015708 [Juglans regia]